MAGQPWLSVGPISIRGDEHELPNHFKGWLPNYYIDGPITIEEHVKQSMLSLKLGAVQHEDKFCKLFLFSFEGKSISWYFKLDDGPIISWEVLKKTFIQKYGEDKTKESLIFELSTIRMKLGESIKDFN